MQPTKQVSNRPTSASIRRRVRVIVAFYASSRFGSEYRSGFEFIRFAASLGFDLAVIADLEQNTRASDLTGMVPGLEVVTIPSPIKKQANLYRYSDFIPQFIWHSRVGSWLGKHCPGSDVIWVQNGALPWLPVKPYFRHARTIVWGPVGGGGHAPAGAIETFDLLARMREWLRNRIERYAIRIKTRQLRRPGVHRVIAMARTSDAQHWLRSALPRMSVPIVPEILDPVPAVRIPRMPVGTPRFLWVGQDVPRKNLALALTLFERLHSSAFPGATMNVFGCSQGRRPSVSGVTFHGWVGRVDWESYRADGVLLLTSFREGLPSAVLEAVSRGLLCIASDVGAVSSLGAHTIHVLPRAEYPHYSTETLDHVAEWIKRYLAMEIVEIPAISFRPALVAHLRAHGVME